MEIELKHTWRVSRSAWYIRLYLWLWEADPAQITFCKIFWAYIFCVPAFFVKCIVLTVKSIILLSISEYRGAMMLVQAAIGAAIGMFGMLRISMRFMKWLLRPVAEVEVYEEALPHEPSLKKLVLNTRNAIPDVKKYVPKPKPRVKPPVIPKVVVPKQPSFMAKSLEHIELGAAWSGMKARELATVGGSAGVKVGQEVRLTGIAVYKVMEAIWEYLIWPVVLALALALGFVGKLFIEFMGWLAPRIRRFIARVWRPLAKCLIFALILFNRHILPVLALGTAIIAVVVACYFVCSLVAGIEWDGVSDFLGSVPGAVWGFTSGLALVVADFLATTAVHGSAAIGSFLPTLGLIIGIGVGVILLGLLMAWGMTQFFMTYFVPRFIDYIFHPVQYGARTTVVHVKDGAVTGATALKQGTVSFGQVMLIGFKAVKSNTCPRVEIED